MIKENKSKEQETPAPFRISFIDIKSTKFFVPIMPFLLLVNLPFKCNIAALSRENNRETRL